MTLPFRRIVLALFTRHLSSKFTALQPATSRGDVAARITVHGGGKQIEAAWDPAPESIPSTYHSVWLRHNCQCSQCLSPSGQKVVVSAELDPNVTVTEASITEDGVVKVKWSCGHEGHLQVDWLKEHCYSKHSLDTATKNGKPISIASKSLPSLEAGELDSDHGVWRWLRDLNEHGVCLLRGMSTRDEDFVKIAGKIGHIQKTIYNEMFEVKAVEDPINIAYSTVGLEPHMDLEYYESPPGLQLLLCARNDACITGGESIMVDGLAVLESLRHTHLNHFSTLARVPATFQKIHYERDDPVHMTYRRPHILLNANGQIISFNWSPVFEGALQAPEEDVVPYYEAYCCLAKMISDPQFVTTYRLNVGDVLTFNNHRMVHGRHSFQLNGGTRLLKGLYINIDEFKSKFRVLCSRYDPDYHIKHVFNSDHGF